MGLLSLLDRFRFFFGLFMSIPLDHACMCVSFSLNVWRRQSFSAVNSLRRFDEAAARRRRRKPRRGMSCSPAPGRLLPTASVCSAPQCVLPRLVFVRPSVLNCGRHDGRPSPIQWFGNITHPIYGESSPTAIYCDKHALSILRVCTRWYMIA